MIPETLKSADEIAIDIETAIPPALWGKKIPAAKRRAWATSPAHAHPTVITLAARDGEAHMWHFRDGKPPAELVSFLNETNATLVAHNGVAFDYPVLARVGIAPKKIADTMIAEQMLVAERSSKNPAVRNRARTSLDKAMKRRLGVSTKETIDHAVWQEAELPADAVSYAKADVANLLRMYDAQRRDLAAKGMSDAWEMELRLMPIVLNMAKRGLPFSREKWDAYVESQTVERDRFSCEMAGILGRLLSPNAHAKLKAAINELHGADAIDSTAKNALMGFMLEYPTSPATPYIQTMMRARAASKRVSMYGGDFLDIRAVGERLYGSFKQMGAHTGRFSSSDPNLQQIPRDMRGVFAAGEGRRIVKADYSGLEARMTAHVAQDADLRDTMIHDDLHSVAAEMLYRVGRGQVSKEMRRIAKALSFTFTFGGGQRAIRMNALNAGDLLTKAQAESSRLGILTRYPATARWHSGLSAAAARFSANGQPLEVSIEFGYKLQYAHPNDYYLTTLANNIVQGKAAIGMKLALLEAHRRGLGEYMVATVHDEILAEVNTRESQEYERELNEAMVEGMGQILTYCPPIVESQIGESWGA